MAPGTRRLPSASALSRSEALLSAANLIADQPTPSVWSAVQLATFVPADQIATLVQRASAVSDPALCSVTASGRFRRPAAARSSASIASPLRVTVSARNLFAKFSERFLRSLRKCRASALGAGTPRWLRYKPFASQLWVGLAVFGLTGVNMPGRDMVARIATGREPFESTTESPLARSVATQRNGVGN